jgi:hypothetical protein
MDILNQIILGLNKEDIRHFKLMAKRMYDHEERKDIELFDYIRHSDSKYNDEKIFKKLYKDEDKNSFYRLKNRLIEDVNESILLLHYRKDDVMYVLHLLSLVRFYFSKNQYTLALRFVKKAETEAERTEGYELLDIIYGEYIKLSHEIVSVDPENYIKKRKDNREKLSSLRQIDDILAAVSYRLKITQNFSDKETPVLKLLEKTINDFSNDSSIKNSPKLRFKIYSAVSQVLLQKHDYVSLEKYLLSTYSTFIKEGLFNKSNHDTKVQMLTYIVNSLFKNKKNKQSLEYVAQLQRAMEEYNGLLNDKYLFFYYNSLVINYSVIDKDKAIAILEELKENKKVKNTSFYDIFIYLNLAILWFDKQNYQNSIRNLNKLYVHDSYKNADATLKFKIAMAELIIRYELNDFDLLEYKIGQLKKDHKKLLKQPEHKRELELISIISQLIESDSIKHNKKLLTKVKLFVQSNSLEDAEIIKYNTWLRSKY